VENFGELSKRLPERHRAALVWFFENAGTERGWPNPLADGTILASRAKGIYKPKWTRYCLSIRQNLGSKYTDEELDVRSDGTWSLLYAQETADGRSRGGDYANRSMALCMSDKVPIGVMRQIAKRPVSRYSILGAGLVMDRYDNHFLIAGFSADGFMRGTGPGSDLRPLIASQERIAELAGAFSPNDARDAREKVIASIVRRRGQPAFRQRLLTAYSGKCAITGCNVETVLEAAHILSYRGPQMNHPSNGLLLRADIHVLFDLGRIAIDTSTMTVVIASELDGTCYAELGGGKLHLPDVKALCPSTEALDRHRALCGL
jgi:putative restriction endonuclease